MNFFSIRDAWSWWLGQLASILLPADPRKEVARLAATELHVAKTGVHVFRNTRIIEPLQASRHVYTEEMADIAAQSLRKRENIVISLDETQCFCREVTLPAGAAARIQNILDLDVGRVTPFTRADVINAWYLTGRADSNSASVEQVIIRKRTVEEVIANVRKAGAKPIAIVVRKLGAPALPFVLAPNGDRYGYKRFVSWVKITTFSIGALILTLALFAGANLYRQSRILAAIDEQIAVAEAAAVKVREHVQRIETASQEVRALQQFRRQQFSVLETWEELSRILPDSAWLQNLTFTQGNINADGLAQSAEDLIPLLEASPQFEKVKFASPVFQNPDEKRSRFSISAQLVNASSSSNPP